MVKISGKVTDFRNRPLAGADIEIENSYFEPIYKTSSDQKGYYHLDVPKGTYLVLQAVKDYKIKYLEYWAWNLKVSIDLNINPRIGGLEVYAVHAWHPQGALPLSLFVYFRPMSLSRLNSYQGHEGETTIINIAPELEKKDIQLKINGKRSPILEMNKVRESAGDGKSMYGYLIQTVAPRKLWNKELRIDVSLIDRKTKERGEGCFFLHAKKQ